MGFSVKLIHLIASKLHRPRKIYWCLGMLAYLKYIPRHLSQEGVSIPSARVIKNVKLG